MYKQKLASYSNGDNYGLCLAEFYAERFELVPIKRTKNGIEKLEIPLDIELRELEDLPLRPDDLEQSFSEIDLNQTLNEAENEVDYCPTIRKDPDYVEGEHVNFEFL